MNIVDILILDHPTGMVLSLFLSLQYSLSMLSTRPNFFDIYDYSLWEGRGAMIAIRHAI